MSSTQKRPRVAYIHHPDSLCVHTAEDSKYQEGRIIQCFMYLRVGSVQDNHYAHPLDLLVYVDMNTGRILDTWMYPEPPAIPQAKANYIAPLVQRERGFRTGDHQCLGILPVFLDASFAYACKYPPQHLTCTSAQGTIPSAPHKYLCSQAALPGTPRG